MKLRQVIFVAVLAAIFAAQANSNDSYTENVDGYEWTFRHIDDWTAEIFHGSKFAAISPLPVGDVTSPSNLGGRTVTVIGQDAFYQCADLVSVTIPSSIREIRWSAFYGCSNLVSVSMSGFVEHIDADAFCDCTSLTDISISQWVEDIDIQAFRGCCALTNITVVPNNPFYSSANGLLLSKDGSVLIMGVNGDVTIPDGVRSIGNSAFIDRTALSSVTFPAGITNIGASAFYGCTGLSSISIPDGVMEIERWTFSNCTNLTTVVISESVTNIHAIAFTENKNLSKVYLPKSYSGSTNAFDPPTKIIRYDPVPKLVVTGDDGAEVNGNGESGYVVRLSSGAKNVNIGIPVNIPPDKIAVEATTNVETVAANWARLCVMNGDFDVSEYLDIPETADGICHVASAKVKDDVARETLEGDGSVVRLDPASPSITTAATRRGLRYTLREGTSPQDMKDGDSHTGDGEPWSPAITVKGGLSGFYSISVGL